MCNCQELQRMYSLIILLLISYVQTQQDTCSCSCCLGMSCSPSYVGNIIVPGCTVDTCRVSCRDRFAQCRMDYPSGQLVPQCSSIPTTLSPLYNCQCDCCKTGSSTCTPFFIGYSTAYVCSVGACSISCAIQYPTLCVSQTGQTVGSCTGPITTTTALSTTSAYWFGNTCSCMCCQTGPNCIPVTIGDVAIQCSSVSCTAACQNRYPQNCPLYANLGQTNGICRNQNTGNLRCRCQCCGINGCPYYDFNTNDCASCNTRCQQQCGTTIGVTYTCSRSNKSIQFSLPLIIFITMFILPIYFML